MPITVTNLTCVYGAGTPFETTALRDVSVTVENGSFVGILGRTGCGKSTLIQIMAGLLTPTAGTVMLDGQDIHARRYDRSILRRKVGIVFQYPECQLFETTVEKDVAFGLKHSGLSAAEKQARVRWALETVGFSFEKVHDQPPMGLSGGEKRRVAIAGVLATKPEYLILDEPIAGLDPLGREAFLQLITELNRGGMTILMVSHNADCLLKLLAKQTSQFSIYAKSARRHAGGDLRRPRLDARAPAGRAAEPHRRRPAEAGRAGHSAGHRKL